VLRSSGSSKGRDGRPNAATRSGYNDEGGGNLEKKGAVCMMTSSHLVVPSFGIEAYRSCSGIVVVGYYPLITESCIRHDEK
jgi:hypothetical protein